MIVYLVTAFRWGNIEEHSYCCGVFEDINVAFKVGLRERIWRGGKYELHIEEITLNAENIMTSKNVNNFWWVDPKEFSQEDVDEAYADVKKRIDSYNRRINMEQTFRQRIAGQLLQLENIIIGFSEGSIQSVYDAILEIANEMDLQKEVVGDLVNEMDSKFESSYIDDCYKRIKELEEELDNSRRMCFKLIHEVNSLRRGVLGDNTKHYEDVERLIQEKYTNIDLRI